MLARMKTQTQERGNDEVSSLCLPLEAGQRDEEVYQKLRKEANVVPRPANELKGTTEIKGEERSARKTLCTRLTKQG